LSDKWKLSRRYEPQMDEEERERLHRQWQEAVKRSKDWIHEEAGEPPL
jgi:glycerol kinase